MSGDIVLFVVLFACWRTVLFAVLLVSSTASLQARVLSCSLSCSCPANEEDDNPDPVGRGCPVQIDKRTGRWPPP